ncbi:hypothetical protein F2Q70_00025564 [Brassica cretica]|uniref:Uncharacterized protein n=1 Tax=Brassica cretica TaxID=69181 RepID=A0A8S9LGX6_BRACR|nr:hypothetical protein F2Q70_00025564 [Brassica cretica]
MRHRATVDSPPAATEHAILAVVMGDRCRLPRGRHGLPAHVSIAVTTGDRRRLPHGRHGRPTHVFLAVAMGDQFLASPGRHEAISFSFFQAGMERAAQRLRITRQACRIAGLSINKDDAVSRTPSREIIRKQTNKGPKLGSKPICKEKSPRISWRFNFHTRERINVKSWR